LITDAFNVTSREGSGGVDVSLATELASTVVINNNVITNNALQGVRVVGSASNSNITISNNMISDNVRNDTIGRGIFVWDSYGTINIINNEITDHPNGIHLLTRGSLLDVTVIDNQLIRNDIAMQIELGDDAIINLSAENNAFSENDIGVSVTDFDFSGSGGPTAGVALQVNIDFGGGILGSVGNNSFITPVGGTGFLIDLDTKPGVVVGAQHNWWGRGSGPTGPEMDVIFGHIDTSSPLGTAP